MYETHPLLTEPSDDTSLWRYMDFTKFVSLLETRSIYFPRITLLDDPFEGHPTRRIVEAARHMPDGLTEEEYAKRLKVSKHNIEVFKGGRKLICVSCWHASNVESAAMWELYLKSGEGIAIRTSFNKIKAAISESDISVSGGLVKYVDYETYKPESLNIIIWAMLKRQSFEHEKEFRAVVLDPSVSSHGIPVPVNLEQLIDTIYVSPTTPDWTVDLINKMIKRYELSCDVIRSQLHEHPMYYEEDK